MLERLNSVDGSLFAGISPKIDQWFLMGSPLPAIGITGFYLIFVTKLGPWLMKNHPGFQLKKIMLAYNVFQILLCTFIFSHLTFVKTPHEWLFGFGCSVERNNDPTIIKATSHGTYWYMIAKLFDLLDTIFFVLRKKSNQITFLHIYHHTLMFACSWYYLKYFPAEAGIFIGLLNSVVHIVMYTYYALSTLGPAVEKYLWWKRYLTGLQIAQFVIVVLYAFLSVTVGCIVDRRLITFYIMNAIFFIYLFGDFYYKKYVKVDSKKKE